MTSINGEMTKKLLPLVPLLILPRSVVGESNRPFGCELITGTESGKINAVAVVVAPDTEVDDVPLMIEMDEFSGRIICSLVP